MDFDLSDEQKMLRETVDRLLGSHIEPSTQSRRLDESPPPDAKLDQALAELGLAEALVDVKARGRGLDLLSLAVVAERLGWHAASSPILENVLAHWLLKKAGARFAERAEQIAAGQRNTALALSESERIFPQDWTIDPQTPKGEKPKVLWGASADYIIVGLAGGRLGLVEADSSGVRRSAKAALDRSRPVCDIVFDGAEVSVLPLEQDIVSAFFDALVILIAADASGAGERATRAAVEYAKERRQFDRPIGSFQGVKHQLANMAVEAMPNGPLVWYAAHLWDLQHEEAARTASLVKAYVADVAVKVGRAAIEIHGGIGYTWEYSLHVYVKRAMADRALFGAPAVHQERAMSLART